MSLCVLLRAIAAGSILLHRGTDCQTQRCLDEAVAPSTLVRRLGDGYTWLAGTATLVASGGGGASTAFDVPHYQGLPTQPAREPANQEASQPASQSSYCPLSSLIRSKPVYWL